MGIAEKIEEIQVFISRTPFFSLPKVIRILGGDGQDPEEQGHRASLGHAESQVGKTAIPAA